MTVFPQYSIDLLIMWNQRRPPE